MWQNQWLVNSSPSLEGIYHRTAHAQASGLSGEWVCAWLTLYGRTTMLPVLTSFKDSAWDSREPTDMASCARTLMQTFLQDDHQLAGPQRLFVMKCQFWPTTEPETWVFGL